MQLECNISKPDFSKRQEKNKNVCGYFAGIKMYSGFNPFSSQLTATSPRYLSTIPSDMFIRPCLSAISVGSLSCSLPALCRLKALS